MRIASLSFDPLQDLTQRHCNVLHAEQKAKAFFFKKKKKSMAQCSPILSWALITFVLLFDFSASCKLPRGVPAVLGLQRGISGDLARY